MFVKKGDTVVVITGKDKGKKQRKGKRERRREKPERWRGLKGGWRTGRG